MKTAGDNGTHWPCLAAGDPLKKNKEENQVKWCGSGDCDGGRKQEEEEEEEEEKEEDEEVCLQFFTWSGTWDAVETVLFHR